MSAPGGFPSSNISLDQVPDEVLRLALSRLDTTDLNRASLVNHRFHNISSALLGRRDDFPRQVRVETVEQDREKSRRFRDWFCALVKQMYERFDRHFNGEDIFPYPFFYSTRDNELRVLQTRLGVGLRRWVKKNKDIMNRDLRLQRTNAVYFLHNITKNLVFKWYKRDIQLAPASGAPIDILNKYRGFSIKPFPNGTISLLHYLSLRSDDESTKEMIKTELAYHHLGGKLSGFTLGEHLFYQNCAKSILFDLVLDENINMLNWRQWHNHLIGNISIPYEPELPSEDPTDIDHLLANYAETNRIEEVY